ncbi:MAG: hypothetical protein COA52_12495 [Hyphomicrobiales bacterium]|nr:MAG: hypothetical protein COA52_12495 [Hyphomicrobiales bacterium]
MLDLLESLRETYETATLVVACALVLGILFGVIAEISRYCLRAAVAEWASETNTEEPKSRVRTAQVAFAILAALAGTQALQAFGIVDLSESIYWSVAIRPLPLIIGGLLFGIGMVLAGGCVSRLLVLAASGNVRAFLTLVITGITAYATLRGILALPRIELENLVASDLAPAELFDGNASLLPLFAAIIAGLALFALLTTRGRGLTAAIVPGVAVGLLVVLGWVITGVVGYDDFDPTQLTSLSFVSPIAESIQYLMIYTGDTIRFSIALVGGVISGAFVSSVVFGRFKFRGFTSEISVLRYIAGGLLMGFGGVTALGCTVGQGIAGLSTAAPSSMIALAAIVLGGYAAMKFQLIAGRKNEQQPQFVAAE